MTEFRVNGTKMRYKGREIEWWKLRDAFQTAAHDGDVEELKNIHAEYPEAGATWTGGLFGTGLYWAAQEGKLDTVKFLVEECGAKLGPQNNDGLSPLVAAATDGHTDVVKYLLDQGADVDERGMRIHSWYTALHWAAYGGHAETVKCLLDHGADSSLKNSDGKTARQIALQQRHPEVAEVIDKYDQRVYMYKKGTDATVKVSAPFSLKRKTTP